MTLQSMKPTKRIFPNSFTSLNLLCGFLSILEIAQQNYVLAAWLIGAAAIFDALDGVAARITKSSSQFGVELDSLSDVVSFGVAPAFLIYEIGLKRLDTLGIIFAGIFLLCGAFRLARFNTQLVGFKKEYFVGLPIPTAALTIAAYILVFTTDNYLSSSYSFYTSALVLTLSFLMVSRFRYETLPHLTVRGVKEKPFHFSFIIISVVSLLLTNGKSIFLIFLFIVLFGIFNSVYLKLKKNK
ncbi:MAG: CDP-diacylglycerol--serine O-phosphatidyltransferase [Ignavibacteriaceae bacterium]|jgi:CDP-diacylglycerol--serine O-phosphatidyltransferase|nr:CDP-diacylglycerol--serine O-phosphatidyltransferase [Ignavibacteriaceae bacterium]